MNSPDDGLRIPGPSPFEDLNGDDHRVDVAVNKHLGAVVYLDSAPLTARRARQAARFLLAAADAADDLEHEKSAVSPEVSDEIARQFLHLADVFTDGLKRANG